MNNSGSFIHRNDYSADRKREEPRTKQGSKIINVRAISLSATHMNPDTDFSMDRRRT